MDAFSLQSHNRLANAQDQNLFPEIATLYDIADDISRDNGKNYTLLHLFERLKNYKEEKFNYEIIEVKI